MQDNEMRFDVEGLTRRASGNTEFVAKLLSAFMDDLASYEDLCSGDFSEADLPRVAKKAHSFKSAAKTIGADRASTVAHVLEQAAAAGDMATAQAACKALDDELAQLRTAIDDYVASC